MTDFNKLFEGANQVLTTATRQGTSIYKPELFEGMNAKQKKAARIKLRRQKDKYIANWFQNKGKPEVLKEIQEVWVAYAEQVYSDTKVIVDNNSSEANKKDAMDFLTAMAQDYKTPAKPAPKKGSKK